MKQTDANTKNWIAQYDGGMITMLSWIGNILNGVCENET